MKFGNNFSNSNGNIKKLSISKIKNKLKIYCNVYRTNILSAYKIYFT